MDKLLLGHLEAGTDAGNGKIQKKLKLVKQVLKVSQYVWMAPRV